MIPHKQLTLEDFLTDCQFKFENDKPAFLSLLEQHINLDEIIPASFYNNFYASTGRTRKYSLHSLLWALIIQRIFSIPTDSLLLVFLRYSKELRDFCGFTKVPDASKITRFKQDFLSDLQEIFDRLVDLTEPICQKIDPEKAAMTIFDSSGIEAFVAENNPKYITRIVKQLKSYAKVMNFDKNFDPYKAAYNAMPSSVKSNPQIKQLFINGHFCYVYKFWLVTNGLGIPRAIAFYNKDFFDAHPDIVLNKKSDSPDEDKVAHDSKLLIPTLKDFFAKHPLINPKTFIGDAAFDSLLIYKELLKGDFGNGRCFSKAFIPLNKRSSIKNDDYTVNEDGIPCCPHDSTLPMKPESTSKLKNGVIRFKFSCPKVKWTKGSDGKYRRQCFCESPCTNSPSGRMIYLYPEKDLRTYPGTLRGTPEWEDTYKTRAVTERSINHLKDNLCVAGRKTRNEKTLHADLLLGGITQLITVLLADKMHCHQYIRSLKPLIS